MMPGMKVYNTEEKELIMELGLKWAANPNILVAAKAFGLRATVQVLLWSTWLCHNLMSFFEVSTFYLFSSQSASYVCIIYNVACISFLIVLLRFFESFRWSICKYLLVHESH